MRSVGCDEPSCSYAYTIGRGRSAPSGSQLLPEAHTPEYDAGYDFRTLFYDCFYRADKRAVILVCLLFLHLEAISTEGEVVLDGAAV